MQTVVMSSCVFAAVAYAPAASAFNLTLAQLNGGPSSASIPSADDSVVATFLYPREVVNTNVATTLSGTLDGGAGANSSLTVETALQGGNRWRSACLIPNFGQFDNDGALHLVAHVDADVDADSPGSFILLTSRTRLGAIGGSIASMMAFINAGTEGTEYFTLEFVRIPAFNTDAEVTAAALSDGVSLPYTQFWGVDPDGGGLLTANSYRFNNALDTFLVALDTDGDGVPNVVTEWGCIQRNNTAVRPTFAESGADPFVVRSVKVYANHQLVDDSHENPGDTDPGQLRASADFQVGTSVAGANAVALDAFLAALLGGPYQASITASGEGFDGVIRAITIDLVPDVAEPVAVATIRSHFIGFTAGVFNGAGGDVRSFSGGLASSTPFVAMGAALPDVDAGLADDDVWASVEATNPASTDVITVWGADDVDLNPDGFPGASPGAEGWSHAFIGWDVGDVPVSFRWGGATVVVRTASNSWSPQDGDVYVRLLDRGFDESTWDLDANSPVPLPMLGQFTGSDSGGGSAGGTITIQIPASIPAAVIYDWLTTGQVALAITADNIPANPPNLFGALQIYSSEDLLQRGPRLVLRMGLLGDVNGDGLVDFADLNLVLGNFNVVADGLEGDLNRDGRVDFADLNEVVSFFNVAKDAR